jgi:hypothetical protein
MRTKAESSYVLLNKNRPMDNIRNVLYWKLYSLQRYVTSNESVVGCIGI